MKNLLKTCILMALCLALLLSTCPASAASYGDFAIVTGSGTLNLRQGPGTEFDRLYTAKRNDWVMILGESGNWYQVMVMDNGKVGYMSKNYLSSANESTTGGQTTGVVSNPVATQYLNLRQYPSLSAPVLGIYYNGATFTVLSSVDNWYQVNIYGQTGYFMKNYVTVASPSAQKTAVISAPNSGKTNLRSAPSMTDSTILSQYPNGTKVQVLLEGNKFWRVSVNGKVGYMDKSLLKYSASSATGSTSSGNTGTPAPAQKPATKGYAYVNNPIATQVLNLREQASATSRVIAQYKNGVRFQVISPGEVWTKVYGSATGNVGYMMTKYLTLNGTASTIKTIQNGNTYVNFRSAPSVSASTVYARLYTGTPITVLTPGDQWTQIRYNGQTGYVMTQFLK
ncbi:MAG: SH3 domain-containing protein [Clostridia bacterium]|nr:SH3 domain-containing protein [Clostridia bacterium]